MPGPVWICTLLALAVVFPCAAETKPPPAGRAFHFAGGRMKSSVKIGENYSAAFWLWNALPADARPVTGYAFSRGVDGDKLHGEHLGIGGTHKAEAQGRLILFNGNAADQLLTGKTKLALKAWHHIVLVREGAKVRVHLDGKPVPDLEGELPVVIKSDDVFIGGRADNFANWEGKLDEFAIFDRALSPSEASQLYQASKMTPPSTVLAPEFPPLSPEEALKSIHVPDGFKVELVACEPNVIDPVAIDWDLAGRLWVVEMADYPSGMDNNGKPGGRVRVLEDTDGDGKYEKSTLFAENLNFPTGLLTWRDGVIVTAAPDILFLRDTNGDSKADHTEKLISGLSEGNQQLRANGLRWGLDNRVYCAAGGHHGGHAANTVLHSYKDNQDTHVGSRDFSFDPDHGSVRPESGPSQFGRNRDDAGHWFGTQNSRALWHYVLSDRYLKDNPYIAAPDPTQLIVTPLNAPVYPVSPPEKRFHSFENAGHFTSACSGMIYRDELLFPRRENELDAFTCEPFHNLVQHNILVEDGVTYKAKRAPGEEKHDFFASTDRWCRPVMTRTGPDGALWVVDMYRYMIEHPAWLPENGRAELLPHYRLGDDKGRIYRVFRTDNPPRRVFPLHRLSVTGLVQSLNSPNEWQRDKVHIALIQANREQESKTKSLDNAFSIRLRTTAEHPNPLVRIHGMYILGSYWTSVYSRDRLLRDENPSVRENALAQAGTLGGEELIAAAAALADDPVPRVRLQFALKARLWSGLTDYEPIAKAFVKLAVREYADPWMRAALMSSAVPHCRALCKGVAAAGGEAFDAYANDLTVLTLSLDNHLDALAALLRPSLTATDGRFTAGQMSRFARLLSILNQKGRSRADLAEQSSEMADVLKNASAAFGFADQCLRDPASAAELRCAAADLMVRQESTRRAAMEVLPGWLSSGGDQALQLAAVRVMASTGEAGVPAILLHDFASLTPQPRNAVIEALLSRETWTLALLEHVKSNPSTALDVTQRARLAQHSSKKVRDLAATVLKAESSRKEVLEHYRPSLALKGDAARGKTVFARCIACHKMEGQGIEIGPDLKSVVNHPPEKLLTNIIDPSLDVQPGFFAFNAKLKDGSALYGLITSETGNSVSFKLIDGSTRLVLRSDLSELKSTGQSLMPAGLEAGMTTQEMADLIAWLKVQK